MADIGQEKVDNYFNEAFDRAVEAIIADTEVPGDASLGESEGEQPCEISGLASYVKDCFKRSEDSRRLTEETWLDAVRMYRGEYPNDQYSSFGPNLCKAFVRKTSTKVDTLVSRMRDLLFPTTGDKNWGIQATPIPELSSLEVMAALDMYAQETGQQITEAELDVLMKKEADRQASKMEKVIEDQLVELKYRSVIDSVLQSGAILGTGCLKGPQSVILENRQYYKQVRKGQEDKWLLEEYDSVTPFMEFVRLWDIYPDMDALTLDEARYVVQRRKMDKHEVLQLAHRADFDADVILEYLKCNPSGDYCKKSYETTLTSLGEVIETASAGAEHFKKYELLEFWGYVDAADLMEAGVEIPEEKQAGIELSANIWILGDKVIKATLSPIEGVKWPYFFYYYKKDDTSIFGQGLPYIMKDVQELMNSAMRAMLDNVAISAGPQLEVNLNLMSEDEDFREVYPRKVWLRTGDGTDASYPAMRVFEIPSYTNEYMALMNFLDDLGDEVTTIPKYMWGEPSGQAARTASGLSMLMTSANITLKDQVKSFDEGITKPFITAMYHWNMQFNENEDVKGDYSVVATGSTSMIAKEMRLEKLLSFGQMTANQMDNEYVNRAELIRSISKELDLSDYDLVYSEEEINASRQQAQKQAEEERNWMNQMVEIARTEGISPTSLLDSLRMLRREMSTPMPTEEQAIEQAQQQLINEVPGAAVN